MLLSMTGYGRATGNFNGKTINAEVRALNSKLTDLKLRLPGDYKEKEIELRKLITDLADRGKIDSVIDVQSNDGAANVTLNEALFKGYFRELSRISSELGIEHGDIVQTILRIPNVVTPPSGELEEEEWDAIIKVLKEALENLKKFRRQEGKALAKDLSERVGNIVSNLTAIGPFEEDRLKKCASGSGPTSTKTSAARISSKTASSRKSFITWKKWTSTRKKSASKTIASIFWKR